MPSGAMVKGYEQLQAANRKLIAAVQPGGALGKAIVYGTQQLQQGVAERAHRNTGTYASSQMADVQGLVGHVYTASNRNPKSGQAASVYGPYEEARGGSHAAYGNTVRSDAPGVMAEAVKLVIEALP